MPETVYFRIGSPTTETSDSLPSRHLFMKFDDTITTGHSDLDSFPQETSMEFTKSTERGSDVNSNQPEAIANAEAAGQTVVFSDSQTILLDLDNADSQFMYERVLPIIQRHIPITEDERWASKSGNLHVKLILAEPLPVMERILIQSALGSDPVREFLTMLRVQEGNPNPSMLFRPTPGPEVQL